METFEQHKDRFFIEQVSKYYSIPWWKFRKKAKAKKQLNFLAFMFRK